MTVSSSIDPKADAIRVLRPRSGWIPLDVRELVEGRELLYFLARRDVMVRYKQTVLGIAWAVLQPVCTMAIFTVIFGRLAGLPSDGLPYAVFVYAGLLPWMMLSSIVTGAAQSLVNQQSLLTKVYLPRLFVPASSMGSALTDFAVSFVVYLALMLWYGVVPGWGLFVVPALVLLTVVAALGVGIALSALTVTYRDFRHVMPFLVQIWMFLSPVIYPVSMVPERWQWLLALNPAVGIIDGFRAALLGREWNLLTLAVSSVTAAALFVFSLYYFRRTERRFADIA